MFDRPKDRGTMEGRFTTISQDCFRRSNKFNSFAMAIRKQLHFITTEATPQRNHTTSREQTSSKAPTKAQIHEDTSQDKDSSGIFGNQMVTVVTDT